MITDVLWLALMGALIGGICWWSNVRLRIPAMAVLGLLTIHAGTTAAYYVFALTNVADANGYHAVAEAAYHDGTFEGGDWYSTGLINAISTALMYAGAVHKVTQYVVYSTSGFVGILLLLHVCLSIAGDSIKLRRLAIMLCFFPGLHFWTSMVGKDALVFLGIAWLLFSFRNGFPGIAAWLLPLLLVSVVRPHVGALVGMAIVVAAAFPAGRAFRRVGTGVLLLLMASVAAPMIMMFAGLEEASFGAAGARLESLAAGNMYGGSEIDLQDSNVAIRLASFMFRPLPFEAHSATALLASLENCVLIVLAGFVLRRMLTRKWRAAPFQSLNAFAISAGVALWLVLGFEVSNLGLATRAKVMVLPFLFVFALVVARPAATSNASPALRS